MGGCIAEGLGWRPIRRSSFSISSVECWEFLEFERGPLCSSLYCIHDCGNSSHGLKNGLPLCGTKSLRDHCFSEFGVSHWTGDADEQEDHDKELKGLQGREMSVFAYLKKDREIKERREDRSERKGRQKGKMEGEREEGKEGRMEGGEEELQSKLSFEGHFP